MTPEERADTYTPPPPRGLGRTERHRVTPRGGIGQPCGCRYTRLAGQWEHITPCPSHTLALFPIADERLMELISA